MRVCKICKFHDRECLKIEIHLYRNAMGKSNYTCEVKVPMHDDLVDFKSIDNFPEYSEVLQGKCQVVEFGKKKKRFGH